MRGEESKGAVSNIKESGSLSSGQNLVYLEQVSNGEKIKMKKYMGFIKAFIVCIVMLMACETSDDGTGSQINTGETENNNDDNSQNEKHDDQNATSLAYDDFKGMYVIFEDEPYHSPIISDILVLGDDDYRTFNRWDYDMTSTIQDQQIDGNTLTINIDSDENEMWGSHSETGIERFELDYHGDEKVLYHHGMDDFTYYPMSEKALQENYKQTEVDYARIIMTLRGVPSLDSWEAFTSEYDGDKPVVGVSHYDKGDVIPYTEDDDVGYPESVTTLYLKNKTRQDEISYTYSSIENGYIRVYPIPINHAIKTGEEVIDDAEKKYIEPFEPYEVADFIGNVELDEE